MKLFNQPFIFLFLAMAFSASSQDWPTHYLRTDIIGAWTRGADFDLDGDPDILVQAGDTIYWYENLLPGWATHVIDDNFLHSEYAMLDIADIDGDGDIDVLKAPLYVPGQDSLSWNENLGNGAQWEEHFIVKATNSFTTSSAAVADIDGDGDLDLGISEYDYINQTEGGVYWMENLGNSELWTKHDIASGFHWYCLVGDIDGDEDIDLFASGNGDLFWYENHLPDTVWTVHGIEDNSDFWLHFYGIGQDIDLDGDLDLISGMDPDGSLVWYQNPGWEKILLHTDGANTGVGSSIGDLDGDGDLDVPHGNLGGVSQTLAWSENPGVPRTDWVSHDISPATTKQFVPTGLGDFDLDGDLDLVVTEFDFSGLGASLWAENPLLSSVHPIQSLPTNAILSASPNPFSNHTTIQYQLLEPGEMELALFYSNGEKIALLEFGYKPAGQYSTAWSGPPGLYLLQLTLNGKPAFLKLVRVND